MAHRRIRANISGRVQGVGFRMWTQKTAQSLGLQGWVRNNQDGSVEALIEGAEEIVSKMIEALHQGPRVSKVDSVVVADESIEEELIGFKITRDT